jgi:hypothetical protein
VSIAIRIVPLQVLGFDVNIAVRIVPLQVLERHADSWMGAGFAKSLHSALARVPKAHLVAGILQHLPFKIVVGVLGRERKVVAQRVGVIVYGLLHVGESIGLRSRRVGRAGK